MDFSLGIPPELSTRLRYGEEELSFRKSIEDWYKARQAEEGQVVIDMRE
jgi:hypothetical protein